jgi:hypothetical protein
MSVALPVAALCAEPAHLAQATPAAKAGTPPPTVGERPVTPTAEEIALRDHAVLLKRGAGTIDLTLAYAYSEQALFPVVRAEQRTVGANAALRYGVYDDVQVTVRVPRIWRRTSTFTDAAISGTNSNSPTVTSESFTSDAAVSLLGVALREAAGRPNVILSLDGVVSTGPGDQGIGGGVVISKSYDPAVIFAGFSYLYGLNVDSADSQRALAQRNFGLNLGYTYALNDSLALSTLFFGTYRNTQSPDGVSIPPPRERYLLQLGMTWLLARGLFVEPSVAMRLGSVGSDLTFAVNFAYSF